ncbi:MULTISPECIES: S8 family serine peptidase [Microbacterium]|uniref:Peptidase S8 n=1 Tax=Microbacterium wangchenii TaxID=2541726 RepID=A0ABX5SVR6_9MICO|nr:MULTISPECIES: S8 family serine peptidase [Microbacterium]MCK6067738.1 S8 family serine peptidase [Microbacterium sp. EYE_512]QBR89350.1 peptidase S8 [Microbacterium wangchenii]TFV81585.1 peptidase S8 [Microbacterium sp. dk485]TXK11023.1 S8 family serine peptidase [Microbacterium wangchenii]
MRRLWAAAAALAVAGSLTGAAVVPEDPTDPVRAGEYWLDQYGVRDAWQTTRGAGIRIAVIDTGVGRDPVEFAGVVDGTDVSELGSPDGRTPIGGMNANHGSWVASLAGARGTGEGRGMIGVAPEAEILSVSIDISGREVPVRDQIAQAIRWSVDNGAQVINMSLTTNTLDWDPSWDEAFSYAFDNDVVIVVAAGNRGSGTTRVGAPATIPGVLTVGGVDPSGTASVDASTQGITIGVSAPSERLMGVSADGTLVQWNGTSGAAPIVAGIVALVRSAHPGMDANNVLNRIISTATPAAGATSRPDLLYGYGLVNAAAAVSAPVPPVSANPMGDLAEWIRLYRRADADPVPQPTSGPVEVPPLAAAEAATEPPNPLLPTEESLRYGSLPLAAGTIASIMVVLGLTAAARRIRLARESRTPSRPPT